MYALMTDPGTRIGNTTATGQNDGSDADIIAEYSANKSKGMSGIRKIFSESSRRSPEEKHYFAIMTAAGYR